MLLEKAWAKVNKMYYNIFGGLCKNALTVLTGFGSKYNNIEKIRQNYTDKQIIEAMYNGINIEGCLFSVGTKGHAYSLLNVNRQNYILKIRNPWGNIGWELFEDLRIKEASHNINKEESKFLSDFCEKKNNGKYYLKDGIFAIVEPDLRKQYENLKEDNGIFFISLRYFYKLFINYDEAFSLLNNSVIEYLFKFDKIPDSPWERYFYFHLKVDENSNIQFNLTDYIINNFKKMVFNKCKGKIFDIKNRKDDLKEKLINYFPKGEYIIEWHYNYNKPYYNQYPEEVLFWITYSGNIDVKFLGSLRDKLIDGNNPNYILKGFNLYKQEYKINEKLGKYYSLIAESNKMLKYLNIITDEDLRDKGEGKGIIVNHTLTEDNLFITRVINNNNLKNELFIKNLDFPKFINNGITSFKNRIIGPGNIFEKIGDRYIKKYTGFIYFNLPPRYFTEGQKKREL